MGILARRNPVGQECPTYILEFDNTLVSGMALATGDCSGCSGKHRTAHAVTLQFL